MKALIVIVLLIGAILLVATVGVNVESQNAIRDTASDVMDFAESTGEGLNFETHESPLPALWEIAKDIAQGE